MKIREYNESVYVLYNEELNDSDITEFIRDNYEGHEKLKLVEENEPSVAMLHGYIYCIVYHKI